MPATDAAHVLPAPPEFDVYTAPAFRESVVEAVRAGRYRIVVDLTDVTYIDSTGLGVLVGALKRCELHGGWLRLACMSARVRRLFRTTGLDRAFVIGGTVEDAINHESEGATP